jgi:hypothetical protein
MAASPVNAQGSGQVKSDGTFSFAVIGLAPGLVANWTALVSGVKGIVGLFQGTSGVGGSPLTSPLPITNGGAAIGPLTTQGLAGVWVQGSGGQPQDTIVVELIGLQGQPGDDLGSSLGSSIVGVAQSSPAQLLAGQLGRPIVENFGVSVPGAGNHFYSLPQSGPLFDVSGFGALLVYGDPPPASTSLWLAVVWYDATGSQIGYSQIDALNPKFAAVIGCLSSTCQVWIVNADSTAHVIAGLTIIPLVSMPAHPELLLPVAGGNFPATITPTTPPATAIIDATLNNIAASGGQATATGLFTWPGKAKLNVGTGSVTWHGRLQCTDAAGVVTIIADNGNVAWSGPIDVELTSGLASVTVTNNGAAAISPPVTLIASS